MGVWDRMRVRTGIAGIAQPAVVSCFEILEPRVLLDADPGGMQPVPAGEVGLVNPAIDVALDQQTPEQQAGSSPVTSINLPSYQGTDQPVAVEMRIESSYCGGAPYIPPAELTNISIQTDATGIKATVTILLPSVRAYCVQSWGDIQVQGDTLIVDTQPQYLPGVYTTEYDPLLASHEYDLSFLPGGTYVFAVKAWGQLIEEQDFAVSYPPDQPDCVWPTGGVIDVMWTPVLESSAFSDEDEQDIHATTQWQVDDNSDFSSPVWDYTDADSDKTHQAVPAGTLAYGTTYHWRVRYQDSQGRWGEWSSPASFLAAIGPSPVYRFWSPVLSQHFYTISVGEKDKLINNYSNVWTYEGVAYIAFGDDTQPGTSAVYRFWSDTRQTHFYTMSRIERDILVRFYPRTWTYEGVAFYAYAPGAQPAGTSAVYRFRSSTLGSRFYTLSQTERDNLINLFSSAWKYEKIAWYAYGA